MGLDQNLTFPLCLKKVESRTLQFYAALLELLTRQALKSKILFCTFKGSESMKFVAETIVYQAWYPKGSKVSWNLTNYSCGRRSLFGLDTVRWIVHFWSGSTLRSDFPTQYFCNFFCWGTKSIWLCYLVWTKFELILLFEQFELLTNLAQSQREVLFCSQLLLGSSWHWWSLCIRNGFLKFSNWCSKSFQVLGSFSGNCIIHPIFPTWNVILTVLFTLYSSHFQSIKKSPLIATQKVLIDFCLLDQ